MSTYEEVFVSGFCKAQNQTRMVICEFEIDEEGNKTFLESDCAYGTCQHTGDCQLMNSCLPSCFE